MSETPTFADLFAGIGGIRIGFETAGCRCVLSNDNDKFCKQTYTANFGSRYFVPRDIRDLDSSQLQDFDILCAGFPCQPFSAAGLPKKNSLDQPHGFEDETHGTAFGEIERVIKDKQPQAFFLENVKSLKWHDGGKTLAIIGQTLEEELGYSLFPKVINAKGLVPQNRERIYLIGFKDKNLDFVFPNVPELESCVGDILQDNVPEKYTLSEHLQKYLQDYAERHHAKGNGFGYGLVDRNDCSRTLSARYGKDGSEILIETEGGKWRRLTPRECARLQGFPDSFRIPVSDTQAYKQFGNSVAVPLMEILAQAIVKTLTERPQRVAPPCTVQQRLASVS
jgi:DNA (cytosine-5)-methyltransferase 1